MFVQLPVRAGSSAPGMPLRGWRRGAQTGAQRGAEGGKGGTTHSAPACLVLPPVVTPSCPPCPPSPGQVHFDEREHSTNFLAYIQLGVGWLVGEARALSRAKFLFILWSTPTICTFTFRVTDEVGCLAGRCADGPLVG